ncbi:MAG: hypothetical protein AAF547_03940 [Actinomycetota bacterium]
MPFFFIDDLLDLIDTAIDLFDGAPVDEVIDTTSETPVSVGGGSEPLFAGIGCDCGLNPNICGSGPFCRYGS